MNGPLLHEPACCDGCGSWEAGERLREGGGVRGRD
jgi:hypothetical protein